MVRDVLEPLSSSQVTSLENVHSCQEQRACLKWFSLSLFFGSAWKLLSTFQGTWGHCWWPSPHLPSLWRKVQCVRRLGCGLCSAGGEVMTKEQMGMGAGERPFTATQARAAALVYLQVWGHSKQKAERLG